jgi:putative Ca2+/H+ antiporter (TMEM165/GDT1 family)
MLILFGVIVGMATFMLLAACLTVYFSDYVSEFFKAKTEEIQAMTNFIKQKQEGDN